MTSLVRAVLFDYGLVLSGPPSAAAWSRMKLEVHAEEQPFSEAYWRWRHAYDRGDLTGDGYWDRVAADLGRSLNAAQRNTLKQADTDLWTEPNEPMIAWAAELKRAGILTGILSNIGDAMEEGVRSRCEWLGGFDHHTFSHRLRLAKPDLEIYRHAAKGLGVAPAEILFVDDRADNVRAAQAAGMQAIQYIDHELFRAALQAQGLADLLAFPTERA